MEEFPDIGMIEFSTPEDARKAADFLNEYQACLMAENLRLRITVEELKEKLLRTVKR